MQARSPRHLVSSALGLLLALGCDGAAAATAKDNILAAGKLWGQVQYLHPWLAYRDIDWQGAFAIAVPKIQSAQGAQAYATAVDSMLGTLGDPGTHLYRPENGSASPAANVQPQFGTVGEGIVVVSMHHYPDAARANAASAAQWSKIAQALATAKAAVFDLRADAPVSDEAAFDFIGLLQSSGVQDILVNSGLAAVSQRARSYKGFTDETQFDAGYSSALTTTQPTPLVAATFSSPPAPPLRCVFLLNADTPVPEVAAALRQAGRAVFVAQGQPSDWAMAPQIFLDAGQGQYALLRQADMVQGYQPAVVVDYPAAETPGDAASAPALQLAEQLAQPGANWRYGWARPLPSQRPQPIWHPGDAGESDYPDLGHRLVAVFKSYAVINFFFPYFDLMGDDWDAALSEAVDGVSVAGDALAYETAVAHQFTHIHDSHSFLYGPALSNKLGYAYPPLIVRSVEGQFVVVRILDAVATQAGVSVGDIITQVDGEAVAVRADRLAAIYPASTPQALLKLQARDIVTGADGSMATLTLTRADGSQKTLQLPRNHSYSAHLYDATDGPVYSVSSNNIGYVDLSRFTRDQFADMSAKLGATRAIVFDMRGYPHQTGGLLSAWISRHPGARFARFERKDLQAIEYDPDGQQFTTTTFYTTEPEPLQPAYAGKTYMLIDDRAMSQSEYTGMRFRGANGTVFVGSPSTGADGDITFLTLPGNMTSSFTGQGVAYPDGTPTQRKGLQPDIAVTPTLAGLRAGKDEVLDAAMQAALHDTGG